LVVACVELKELNGRGLLSLTLEEFSHKLDLFELAGELHLV
jgi:hypothetical protein